MIRHRHQLLFLLGTGASFLLVLESINLWTSRSPSFYSRIPNGTSANFTSYHNDESVNVASVTNVTVKQNLVKKTIVTQSSTRKTTQAPDPLYQRVDKSLPLPIMKNMTSEVVSKNQAKPTKVMGPEEVLRKMGNLIVESPVQSAKSTRHVLVVSYFRAGSSFTGDLLQQNWKTFYTFEPLHFLSEGLRINDNQLVEALPLLKDLMYCNFSSPRAIKYLQWASETKNNFLMHHNKFLYVTYNWDTRLIFKPDFVGYLCDRAPWQVMKINRLSLEQVGQFVRNNPELDIRVLHLVRDPRGTFSSRKVLSFSSRTSCGDFNVLCKEMDDDYQTFQRLKKLDTHRYFQLRYEDLASSPNETSRQVFEALNLPYTEAVTNYLNYHTKASTVNTWNPYSTLRDSSETAFEWRKKLKLNDIRRIQAACESVLNNYDYLMVNSSHQLLGNPQKIYSSQKSWLRR